MVIINTKLVYQWLKHGIVLDNGKRVTLDVVRQYIEEEYVKLEPIYSSNMSLALSRAIEILDESLTSDQFVEFASLPAYRYLVSIPPKCCTRSKL